MPFASGADGDLVTRLTHLPAPVRLLFFTQTFGCELCLPARQAVDQIASLSDRIAVEEYNVVLDTEQVEAFGIDRAPAVAVVADRPDQVGHDAGIRYYGIASGYESAALVDAVVRVAANDPGLSAASVRAIDAQTTPIHIRVFVTPTCRYCPQVVSLAYAMAVASPHITASVIEASEFPDLAQQYQVTGVPKTVVDDRVEILGAVPEAQFVAQVLGIDTGPDAPA